ncbi:hypothetical protein C8Q73DRAFT_680493 [Cubamyces lactineus]|nr:hypothetical protein C8Q73DRAFT_680493 [Cubamyces lactineus]
MKSSNSTQATKVRIRGTALSPTRIRIKQRSLWRFRALRRQRELVTWWTSAIRRISQVVYLVLVHTTAYFAGCCSLLLLTDEAPVDLRTALAWHALLWECTFLYALFVIELKVGKDIGLTGRFDSSNENRRLQLGITATSRCCPYLLNVFVLGAGSTSVVLRLPPDATIASVQEHLRKRHLIPALRRVHQYYVFPPFSSAPLECEVRLRDIGVSNGSTIHLRTSVLGGSHDSNGQFYNTQMGFTEGGGKFPSEHPELWEPLTGVKRGRWRCRVCDDDDDDDHDGLPFKRIRRHEQSQRHQDRLRVRLAADRSGPGWNTSGSSSTPQPSPSSTKDVVRSALLDILDDKSDFGEPPDGQSMDMNAGLVDWSTIVATNTLPGSSSEAAVAQMCSRLKTYLLGDGAISDTSSDAEAEEGGDLLSDVPSESAAPQDDDRSSLWKKRYVTDEETEWFPWPDKETCVLDILRHVPRCAFSNKQNTVIHWALLALGVKDVPSEHTVDRVTGSLQQICGISSLRYQGAMGHVYYVNDFAQIVAQEMANPRVRPHLRFLPEDSGPVLAEAWQAARWREELDPDLATPMLRQGEQDFYVYEPARLQNGSVCMPVRWYQREGQTFARVWAMEPTADRSGWIVRKDVEFDVCDKDFLVAFPDFVRSVSHYVDTPDPRRIEGVREADGCTSSQWSHSDPQRGNRWREIASGHRVVAFPIWLYCDDTSGNLSKKWNKHNSFLFTPAGLPRRVVHQEYNIHFLSTSNIAPPLEMLDGIVEQLRTCQRSGIWAWDCVLQELVLVVPSVLAMLGDNPMQSEISCHVGLAGKFFCRVCKASRSHEDASSSTRPDVGGESNVSPSHVGVEDEVSGSSDVSSEGSHGNASDSVGSAGPRDKGKRRRRPAETMAQMIDRVRRFMSIGTLRTAADTLATLKSQFTTAQRIGGQTDVKTMRTSTGVKDTYQGYFIDKLFTLTGRRRRTRAEKEADVADFLKTVPHVDDSATSPVWRIQDFNPHSDTPVEILHVVLLGFVKYLWRDTVSRVKSDSEKAALIARLSSFDVSALGIPPLAGATLVTYAGSLVGRDFRAIAQAAPFVLHDLSGIPDELHKVWTALSSLIPLVWQPEIKDLETYIARLTSAIDQFLDATCALTPRWFNKPKFHIVLHLPAHIRRFGPAMLFATEGFESFNAVIRSHSVHSNHRAPSRDIAIGMAHHNRIRHFLSGGLFRMPRIVSGKLDEVSSDVPEAPGDTATTTRGWIGTMARTNLDEVSWRRVASGPISLLDVHSFDTKVLGIGQFNDCANDNDTGSCRKLSTLMEWEKSLAFTKGFAFPRASFSESARPGPRSNRCRIAGSLFVRANDSWCLPEGKSWLLWRCVMDDGSARPMFGRLWEILQIPGARGEAQGQADLVLVQISTLGPPHPYYAMPPLEPSCSFALVSIRDIICAVNAQHDCHGQRCTITKTRVVVQERERTSKRDLEVFHHGPNKYILNVAQMRSSALLMSHYPAIPALNTSNREDIIYRAAMREVELRQSRRSRAQEPSRTPSVSTHAQVPANLGHATAPPVASGSRQQANSASPFPPAARESLARMALLSSYRHGALPLPTSPLPRGAVP